MAEAWKLPLADGIDWLLEWLAAYLTLVTRPAADLSTAGIEGIAAALAWPPPWLFILLAGGLAYAATRRWPITAFAVVGLGLIWNLGLWAPTMDTLALVLAATAASIALGLPLGVAGAVWPWFRLVLEPILDFMQTLPAFVYLLPAIPFFGIGTTSAMISTIIFAMPPTIRLTMLGIRQVPADLVEAANAFGATTTQKLVRLELPLALPSIQAGINQTVMLSLSMVVIAAMIGAGGLGSEVLKALNRNRTGDGFEAGICIVILAIILDRALRVPSRRGV